MTPAKEKTNRMLQDREESVERGARGFSQEKNLQLIWT